MQTRSQVKRARTEVDKRYDDQMTKDPLYKIADEMAGVAEFIKVGHVKSQEKIRHVRTCFGDDMSFKKLLKEGAELDELKRLMGNYLTSHDEQLAELELLKERFDLLVKMEKWKQGMIDRFMQKLPFKKEDRLPEYGLY